MQIISVVRDFDLYEKLVKSNPYNQNAELHAYDNRIENQTITKRYNYFINSYDYSKPDWFVFCHEDWEMQEGWQKKVENLDKNTLYAPIGTAFYNLKIFGIKVRYGQVATSNKDGSERTKTGVFWPFKSKVKTFDCQCMLVHSSLIEKYALRFDENLSFDLYIEDFCINAMENNAIESKVLQLKCQHYSFGNAKESFWQQFSYLSEKYKDAKSSYLTTLTTPVLGKAIPKLLLKISHFAFYDSKITRSGRRIIKICKIPVWLSKKTKKNNAA